MRIGNCRVPALVLGLLSFAGCAPDVRPTGESMKTISQALEDSSSWTPAAVMLAKRNARAALKLTDGRVLVIGGTDNPSETAEWYDAGKNTWTRINVPNNVVIPANNVCRPALVQLESDLVLVVSQDSAWSFDIGKDVWKSFSLAAGMCTPQAIALGGEKALIWTGSAAGDAYLYDSGTITPTASLPAPKQGDWSGAAVIRLNDGRVLISGGSGNTEAVLYDAADANTWVPAGSMFFGRSRHAVALMPNGNVLAAGGDTTGPYMSEWSDTVEIFDFSTR